MKRALIYAKHISCLLCMIAEFDRGGVFVALEEVDASSEVRGEVTMLNTLEHYKVTRERDYYDYLF